MRVLLNLCIAAGEFVCIAAFVATVVLGASWVVG